MKRYSNEKILRDAARAVIAIDKDPKATEAEKKAAKEIFAKIKKGLQGNEVEQMEAAGLEADLTLRRFPVE